MAHVDSGIPDLLAKNLAALAVRDAVLAGRLLLPVRGEHVRVQPDGRATYRRHDAFLPLAIPDDRLPARVPGVDRRRVFVFGVGLGDGVHHILTTDPDAEVVAWDRDPWLLRLALIRYDLADAIEEGRLELRLGVDLLDLVEGEEDLRVIAHPLLVDIYRDELFLLERGVGPRRAAVCAGALFVDDLSDGLRDSGYDVVPLDVERWSREELEYTVERLDPELVAGINYTSGLAEFCHAVDRPLLVWEIDPSTDPLSPVRTATPNAHVYTYRQRNVEAYRRAGFEHVETLHLASNTTKRRPLELGESDRARYGAAVSFVGSSMVANARELMGSLRRKYAEWHPDGEAALARWEHDLVSMLAEQAADYSSYRLPDLFEREHGEFLASVRSDPTAADPVTLLAETAAADKRREWIAALADHGVEVWGDDGWRALESRGVRWRGPAGHGAELTRVFNATRINVDVGRVYQMDIVTMRVFDVLACGGFLIAEESNPLRELFEVGVELESYSGVEELVEKVSHYLTRPDRAGAIARRGCAAVRDRHNFQRRVGQMLAGMDLKRPEGVGNGRIGWSLGMAPVD